MSQGKESQCGTLQISPSHRAPKSTGEEDDPAGLNISQGENEEACVHRLDREGNRQSLGAMVLGSRNNGDIEPGRMVEASLPGASLRLPSQ